MPVGPADGRNPATRARRLPARRLRHHIHQRAQPVPARVHRGPLRQDTQDRNGLHSELTRRSSFESLVVYFVKYFHANKMLL